MNAVYDSRSVPTHSGLSLSAPGLSVVMTHPGAFRLALLSELSRAAILSYIESPRSSIIGKVSSPRRPSTGTVTDAVNRLVPVGTDMRTYLGRLPWFSAESALARCAGWSAAHQRGPTASAGGPKQIHQRAGSSSSGTKRSSTNYETRRNSLFAGRTRSSLPSHEGEPLRCR